MHALDFPRPEAVMRRLKYMNLQEWKIHAFENVDPVVKSLPTKPHINSLAYRVRPDRLAQSSKL